MGEREGKRRREKMGCCSALAVRCLFNYGHAWQELLYQTTVKSTRPGIAQRLAARFHSVHLHSWMQPLWRWEKREREKRQWGGRRACVCVCVVYMCVCVWVVRHEGGRPQQRERERKRKKEIDWKGGVSLRERMREEKDLAKIGRPISAAAAAAACLPLTACSCEPVLGMTANGFAWYISLTHSSMWAQIHLQDRWGCWVFFFCFFFTPLSPYVNLYLIANQCHTNISRLTTYFICRCWVTVRQ